MDQHRGYRGIHPARQAANHPLIGLHQLADPGDLSFDEVTRRPIGNAAADLEEEVTEDLSASRSVCDFRVELHAI